MRLEVCRLVSLQPSVVLRVSYRVEQRVEQRPYCCCSKTRLLLPPPLYRRALMRMHENNFNAAPHGASMHSLPPWPRQTPATPNSTKQHQIIETARGQSTARRSHACRVAAISLPLLEWRSDRLTLRYPSSYSSSEVGYQT